MKSLFPEKYHTYIYIFALVLLVIGMPMSKFLMSLSQTILVCNWLLEGNLKNKIISFYKNKPALVLSSLLLLHFIGLLYTTNIMDGFWDIRIKTPLFILPLVISTSKPLSKNSFNLVLKFFVASVLFGTLFSTLLLTGVVYRPIVDTRGISIFISHIRFALLICVAIFVIGYFIKNELTNIRKLFGVILIIWFIIFLILMESLTGLAVLLITSFVLLIYSLLKSKNKWLKYGLTLLILSSITWGGNSIRSLIRQRNENIDKIDFSKLEQYTSHGNLYKHGINSQLTENGHFIWIYFCEDELRNSWNRRSKINYDGKDLNGNDLPFTLARFLTSKGLRKDEDAVNSLTTDEIKAIERGVPNVNYQSLSSLEGRVYETLWEIDLYKKTGDANGHSLTQRFEYWKAAMMIIKENIIFGVGTGDVQNAFDVEYVKSNSSLLPKWRLHTHNQYLTITVAFGIIGLLWFLLTLTYPIIRMNMIADYLYITFFIIALISFLTEDTLETQAGVTFYAFLNSFFLFAREKEDVKYL